MKDSGYAPIRLDVESASILEERFTLLEEYLFNDEGRFPAFPVLLFSGPGPPLDFGQSTVAS